MEAEKVNRRNKWFAGLAGMALALAMTATVTAYAGEVAGAITVGGPSGNLQCGIAQTVTATVVDASSNPIADQPVDWLFSASPSSDDRIDPTSTTTDARGVATTTVTLACVPGNRTVTATADDISAGAVLAIGDGAVLGVIGLPRTSTAPDGSPVGNLPIAPIVLLALLVGGGIVVRRFAVSRR